MEGQESIEYFPADVMLLIVQSTSLQAVASLWMSNRYWNRKLSHLMNLQINIIEVNPYKQVFALKQGKAYHIRIRGKLNWLTRKFYPRLEVKSGHFNTVSELQDFISNVQRILASASGLPSQYLQSPYNFFVQISSRDGPPSYFTGRESNNSTPIDEETQKQLWRFIKESKWAPKQRQLKRAKELDGISLRIINSDPPSSTSFYINSAGDMERYLDINDRQFVVKQYTRISPVIYQQLADIASQYGVESSNPEELCISEFKFIFSVENRKLHIEYNVVEEDDGQVPVISGQVEGVDKIIQVLEPVLYNPNIVPLFMGKVNYIPPLYVGHQLMRIPHYRFPFGEQFSSIVAIELIDAEEVSYVLDLSCNAPREEVVALFKQVETAIDYTHTEPSRLGIDISQDRVINRIWIYSMNCVKLVFGSTLSKELVTKLDALASRRTFQQ